MMENQVTLTIRAEGGQYVDAFNVHQRIGHVIRKALEHYGIPEKDYPKYEMLCDDVILNDSASIEDCGLEETRELILKNRGPLPDGN